jgi:hypothetical protein
MHSDLLRFRVASVIQQRLARPGSPCAPNQISCFNNWLRALRHTRPWDEKLDAVLKLSASISCVPIERQSCGARRESGDRV